MVAMDPKLLKLFGDWVDDETLEHLEQERQRMSDTVRSLEATYADRGLRFTVPFYGALPVQAFGELDGYRFYFRFRHDYAELRLGKFDPELERVAWENVEKHRLARIEKANGSPEPFLSHMDRKPEPRVTGEEDDFYPQRIERRAKIPNYTGDEYAGTLNAAESLVLFSKLVDMLEDVPEEEQVLPYLRDLLEK